MTDAEIDEALRTAVAAVLAKLKAEDAAVDAIQQRDTAIRELYLTHHLSMPEIERRLRRGLIDSGLSEEQTKGSGISHDTLRNVVGGRKKRL